VLGTSWLFSTTEATPTLRGAKETLCIRQAPIVAQPNKDEWLAQRHAVGQLERKRPKALEGRVNTFRLNRKTNQKRSFL